MPEPCYLQFLNVQAMAQSLGGLLRFVEDHGRRMVSLYEECTTENLYCTHVHSDKFYARKGDVVNAVYFGLQERSADVGRILRDFLQNYRDAKTRKLVEWPTKTSYMVDDLSINVLDREVELVQPDRMFPPFKGMLKAMQSIADTASGIQMILQTGNVPVGQFQELMREIAVFTNQLCAELYSDVIRDGKAMIEPAGPMPKEVVSAINAKTFKESMYGPARTVVAGKLGTSWRAVVEP